MVVVAGVAVIGAARRLESAEFADDVAVDVRGGMEGNKELALAVLVPGAALINGLEKNDDGPV